MRNIAVAAVALLAAACSHQQQAASSSQNLSMETASSESVTASPPGAAATRPQVAAAPARVVRCRPCSELRQCQPGAQLGQIQPRPSPPSAAAQPGVAERENVSGRQCVPIERQNVAGREQATCPIVRVHFAFDDDHLNEEAKMALNRNGDCWRRAGARINVEGYADERGSQAYNEQLGERRARAVSSYLESLGVRSSDLHPISYGKDRPLCLGHTESCWKQNRRVTLRPGNVSASVPRSVQ